MSILTLQQANPFYLGGLLIWRIHFFLIVYCLQSGLEVLKFIAKSEIFFCLMRNVVTMDSLLERLFSGVDRFELNLTQLGLLQNETCKYLHLH